MNDYGPPGRKRSGDFGRGGGSFSDDGGFRKRQRFDDDSSGGGPKNATLRVLIRNTDAGGIIGKGGENIKRLRKQYDSQVVLPDSAGAPERVMTIMGVLSNCVGVLGDVLNGIAEDPRSTHSKDPNRREVQILIPQPFMGTIIGTQGSKIKELRARTSANIKIFSDPMPGSNERSIQLIGSVEQITECVQHFLDDISKKDPRDPIYLYEPGNSDGPPPGPPMDMRYPPRGGGRGGGGGGGGSFRGRGGGNDGGSWRNNGGGRGGGNRGRGGRGGGRFNGAGSGDGYQFGAQGGGGGGGGGGSSYQGGGRGGGGGGSNVGYGGGSNPPNVGYSGNQSSGGGGGGGQASAQPAPVTYPQQGGGSSNSTYPPPLVPPSGSTPPATQSQQVTIPAEFADAIMGVNGGNLHQIKSQSSCEIVLEPIKPGSNQRIITITGTPNGIQFAQQLMQNSVRQQHPHV